MISCFFRSRDWLEVYDGKDINSPKIGDRLYGSKMPTAIFGSGNELFIRFKSDKSITKSGFQLQVVKTGNSKYET